jgi:hypothetical protein
VLLWAKIATDLNAYSSFAQFQCASDAIYMTTTGNGTTFNLYAGGDNAGSALTVGTWYHLAYTHAGTGAGNLLGYVNGVLDITAAGMSNATLGTASRLWFLNDADAEPLNGCVAAIKVYNGVLTAAEIAVEMRSFRPVRTAGLILWAPCVDRVKADNLIDLSQTVNLTETGTAIAVEDGPPIPWGGTYEDDAVPAAAAPGGGSVLLLVNHYMR